MSKTFTSAGFHISEDPGGDHVFMDVRSVSDEGDMTDVTCLRFKGTKNKKSNRFGRLYTTENLRSKAAEFSIFVPISPDAGVLIRTLAGFLMDLDAVGQLPYEYHSQNKRIPETDVLGRLRICGDQSIVNSKPLKINCFDMVILGCAIAGIDLGKVFNSRDFADNGFNASNKTRNLSGMAVVDQEREHLGTVEGYLISRSKEDHGIRRAFAIAAGVNKAGSPVQAFSAAINTPAINSVLTGPFEAKRPRFDLPVYLRQAAYRARVSVPNILRVA